MSRSCQHQNGMPRRVRVWAGVDMEEGGMWLGAKGWTLNSGLDATPRLGGMALCPVEYVHNVGEVALGDPRRQCGSGQVPDASLNELNGLWDELVPDVCNVELGGGHDEGGWEGDPLDGGRAKVRVGANELGHGGGGLAIGMVGS